MSSSMFIESKSRSTNRRQVEEDDEGGDFVADNAASNTDLVVVLKNDRLHVDSESLERFMEDKAISSLSVIRIASPTPSMIEEEQARVAAEQDSLVSEKETDNSATEGDENNNASDVTEKDVNDTEADTNNDDNSSDTKINEPGETVKRGKKGRKKKKTLNATTTKQSSKKSTYNDKRKKRRELVGVTVEHVYDFLEARKILELAIDPNQKYLTTLETLVEVIRNDHCYTPWTSPSQKLRRKYHENAEHRVSNMNSTANKMLEKHTSKSTSTSEASTTTTSSLQNLKENNNNNYNNKREEQRKEQQQQQKNTKDNHDDDTLIDDELNSSSYAEEEGEYEESEYSSSNFKSSASDNDRDSDLDFRVNNNNKNNKARRGYSRRKRKGVGALKDVRRAVTNKKKVKKRQVANQQQQQNQHQQQQQQQKQKQQLEIEESITNQTSTPIKTAMITAEAAATTASTTMQFKQRQIRKQLSNSCGEIINLGRTTQKLPQMQRTRKISFEDNVASTSQSSLPSPVTIPLQSKLTSKPIAIFPTAPKKIPINNQLLKETSKLPIMARVRHCITLNPAHPVGNNTKTTTCSVTTNTTTTTIAHKGDSHIREIVISKVLSKSPRGGGFTDISTLIAKKSHEENTTVTKAAAAAAAVPAKSAPEAPTMPVIQVTMPISTTKSNIICSSSGSNNKGFIQLESATKTHLSAQISIQTHASSSELAVENEAKLELIDYILKHEMQRSQTAQPSPSVTSDSSAGNENIPKLVKMLESTEVESSSAANKPDLTESNVNAACTDGDYIDIENNESLPADLLQHVADLLSNDKELQEAMEKMHGNDIIVDDHNEHNSQTLHNKIFEEKSEKPESIVETAQINAAPIVVTNANKFEINISITATASSPNTSLTYSIPNQKEPIKIVRGNGRVITLPPIEAPTTRSRLRAQSTSTPKANNNSTMKKTSFSKTLNDSTLNADISLDVSKTEVPATASQTNTSLNNTKYNSRKKNAVRKTANKKKKAAQADDDDDPNKLWCKCRKPHDNRFMICCDSCEEWFHGDCVNLSKQDGDFLEENAIDWLCELCQTKSAKQKKITDMFPKKMPAGRKSTTTAPKNTSKKPIITSTTVTPVAAASEATTTTSTTTTTTTTMPTATTAGATSTVGSEVCKKSNLQQAEIKTFVDLGDLICESVRIEAVKKKKKISKRNGSVPDMKNEILSIDFTGITAINNKNKSSCTSDSTVAVSAAPGESIAAATKTSLQAIVKNNKSEDLLDACIVCKKSVARVYTNYCSDECIRKHAQTALQILGIQSTATATTLSLDSAVVSTSKAPTAAMADDKNNKKKNKSLFEECLTLADTSCKIERVPVFNRKNGHIISGSLAPAKNHLRKWLQDNAGYEVILPGSDKAVELEARTIKKATSRSPTNVQLQKDAKETSSSTSPTSTKSTTSTSSATSTTIKKVEKNISMPGTYIQKPVPPKPKIYKPNTSEASDETRAKEKSTPHLIFDNNGSSTTGEPIRQLVIRTLIEQISHRLQDEEKRHNETKSNDKLPTMSLEEIENFVQRVEAELYRVFQCETNPKYKNKYRSVLFNIKDQSNKTLISRICHKKITPQDLVSKSAAELASQELQKWRENENKHNLEVITKHELDSLKNPSKYVLKSHKGEKVITKDPMLDEFTIADPMIPVRDVFNLMHRAKVQKDNDNDNTKSSALGKGYLERIEKETERHMQENLEKKRQFEMEEKKRLKKLEEKKERDLEREKESDREKDLEKTKERSHNNNNNHSDKEKNKDKDKDRNSHHGERSRHKSKERHRDKTRKRSHSPRSRSRSRDKRYKSTTSSSHNKYERKDEREKQHRERTKEKDQSKSFTENRSFTESKKLQPQRDNNNTKNKNKREKNLEAFNLVDQIITSRKTVEEAANLVPEKKKSFLSTSCPQITPLNSSLQLSSPTVSSISSPTIDTPLSTPRTKATATATATTTVSKVTSSSSSSADWDDIPTSSSSSSKISNEDPFAAYVHKTLPPLWRGYVSMVDVTRLELIIQPLVGNFNKIGTLLPSSLDIVGRISPDSVWDYLAKVKNNLNKEIVLVQFLPAKPSENIRYSELCEYLEQRHRLGVLRAASPLIKDFYLMPLMSRTNFPSVIQNMEPIELFNDMYRPNLLIGIAVRVTGGRRHNLTVTPLVADLPPLPPLPNISTAKNRHEMSTSFPSSTNSKRRKLTQLDREQYPAEDDIDIDAIIKAPIASKVPQAKPPKPAVNVPSVGLYDADEPYSPGGSTDDDMPLLPILATTTAAASSSSVADKTMDIELKRKMDELNRQIAAQEKEIAGLLVDKSASNVLANISIPSNLSQILASINQNKPETSSANNPIAIPRPSIIGSITDNNNDDAGDEEYNPEDDITYAYSTKKIASHMNQTTMTAPNTTTTTTSSTSRLASLSEAELLSMVPDDMIEQTTASSNNKNTNYSHMSYDEEPPPPGV